MFELNDTYYPTPETLEGIEKWKGTNRALMDEIYPLFRHFGSCYLDENQTTWVIKTHGWNGGDKIVEAMSKNKFFWALCWRLSSREDSHHEFEVVPESEDKKPDSELKEARLLIKKLKVVNSAAWDVLEKSCAAGGDQKLVNASAMEKLERAVFFYF